MHLFIAVPQGLNISCRCFQWISNFVTTLSMPICATVWAFRGNFKMTGKRKAGGRCCAGSSLRAPAPAEHLVAIENSLKQPVVFMGCFTYLPISGWISQGNSKDTTSQPASCATHFKKKGPHGGTALQQERLWLSLLRRLLVFSAKAWNLSQAKARRMKDELKLMKSVGPKNKIWFVLKPSERTWSTCKKPSCSQNLFIGCLQPQYFPFLAWNFDHLGIFQGIGAEVLSVAASREVANQRKKLCPLIKGVVCKKGSPTVGGRHDMCWFFQTNTLGIVAGRASYLIHMYI